MYGQLFLPCRSIKTRTWLYHAVGLLLPTSKDLIQNVISKRSTQYLRESIRRFEDDGGPHFTCMPHIVLGVPSSFCETTSKLRQRLELQKRMMCLFWCIYYDVAHKCYTCKDDGLLDIITADRRRTRKSHCYSILFY